jgi:exodeoxyribonuclease VII large subunit
MKEMSDAAAATTAQSNLPELSVSELASAVKRTMETNFDRVRVRGELGRVLVAKSGHLYVDLKDEGATISTVMWKANVQQLGFKPEEGLEVVAEGRLSTYPGRSQYQLICERMSPAGVGALLAQLEKLKLKLQGEGLFARERKKAIPYLPRTIGVVTSPTGAVIRDILHRLGERFPCRVIVWPVLVQGPEAAGQVSRAIKGFNAVQGRDRPDVLIVARGGGSIEDLWAFNEEVVVRAAAASEIPLISAVGHETDTTLDRLRVRSSRADAYRCCRARSAGARRTDRARDLGGWSAEERVGARPGAPPHRTSRRCGEAAALGDALPNSAAALRSRRRAPERGARVEHACGAIQARPCRRAAAARSTRARHHPPPRALLTRTTARLAPAMKRTLEAHRKHLDGAARMLESLSHKSVLARGFVLVHREDGSLVRAAKDLSPGDEIELTFADEKQRAVIDPARVPSAEPTKVKPKPKPGGSQGDLF